jgi:ketosteroid isomerase-like protein
MSKYVSVLFLGLLLCGAAVADEPETAGSGTQVVVQIMHAYEDAWSRHDAHAIAGFYYEPAMRVSASGPTVRATRAMQETFFSGLLANLIHQGYAKSDWEQVEVRLLNENTAIASGVIVRHRDDGSVFQRQGVTYTLWRGEQGWKIFLSATHSPSTALHFR